MKMITLILVLSVMTAIGVGFSVSTAETEPRAQSYDAYNVIYERNIFSKDRLPPRETQAGSGRVRTTQVLSIYVLRGIAAERQEKVAFIEEQVSGQSIKARIGTDLLEGKIKEIKYDYVIFEKNGQPLKIRIGSEFGKKETTVISEVSQTETTDTPAEEVQAEKKPAGDEDDILKKLMERRKSELGN